MGANNGKQYGSEGKGSSSISSDISSSTDHTPTKAPKNVATTEEECLSKLWSYQAQSIAKEGGREGGRDVCWRYEGERDFAGEGQ
ncbi:hypothetical protein INR49_012052, partial [Caranx melampygus]